MNTKKILTAFAFSLSAIFPATHASVNFQSPCAVYFSEKWDPAYLSEEYEFYENKEACLELNSVQKSCHLVEDFLEERRGLVQFKTGYNSVRPREFTSLAEKNGVYEGKRTYVHTSDWSIFSSDSSYGLTLDLNQKFYKVTKIGWFSTSTVTLGENLQRVQNRELKQSIDLRRKVVAFQDAAVEFNAVLYNNFNKTYTLGKPAFAINQEGRVGWFERITVSSGVFHGYELNEGTHAYHAYDDKFDLVTDSARAEFKIIWQHEGKSDLISNLNYKKYPLTKERLFSESANRKFFCFLPKTAELDESNRVKIVTASLVLTEPEPQAASQKSLFHQANAKVLYSESGIELTKPIYMNSRKVSVIASESLNGVAYEKVAFLTPEEAMREFGLRTDAIVFDKPGMLCLP